MDWFLYKAFLLYWSMQSILYNAPHSPILAHLYEHFFLCFLSNIHSLISIKQLGVQDLAQEYLLNQQPFK